MLVPFTQVQIVGLRSRLDDTLAVLQGLRAAQLVHVTSDRDAPAAPEPDDAPLLTRVNRLLGHAGTHETDPPVDTAADVPVVPSAGALTELVDRLEAELDTVLADAEVARTELATLPRYVTALSALDPLVPELAALDDRDLAELHLATVALVVDDPHGRVMAELRDQLAELLGARAMLVATPPRDGSVGALLVIPAAAVAEVEKLLGADRIVREFLPAGYRDRSLHTALATMRQREAALPARIAELDRRAAAVVAAHAPALRAARAHLAARVERQRALASVHRTGRTFLLRAWVPRPRLRDLRHALTVERVGPHVLEERHEVRRGDAPVLLSNSRTVRPFERLVSFLSWPRSDGFDPTALMAFMLPLLFGVMVGDVVYGLALAGIGWWMRRRAGARRPFVADLGRVLVAGGIWATVFGVLFGEALGSLGNKLGMPALWFYRGGPQALEPLLLFAVALGAAHIVLGLVLGVWTAVRHRHRRHLVERVGTLLVLCALFTVAAVAASLLPDALLTPAVALAVVGLALVSVTSGALGILLGPLELLGTIGNVLSYLRLAAVGLASVYLANVANELAANAPLLLGVLVAAFFHALNLALAAFSPMVQALRLHYVEFFGKFHEGSGQPFRPLGAGLPEPRMPEPASVPVPAPNPDHTEIPRERVTVTA